MQVFHIEDRTYARAVRVTWKAKDNTSLQTTENDIVGSRMIDDFAKDGGPGAV